MMPFFVKFLALVAGTLVIPSMTAPVDSVEVVASKETRSSLTNVTKPIDFDPEDAFYGYEYDEDDFEDDFSYLDSNGTSPNPLYGRAAPLAYLDCTGIEELCDANCYAILCLNQPRVLTKVTQAAARSNRRKCGAKYQPFKGTSSQLKSRGVSRPSANYVSAEEYPFASTSQGGSGADLFPALVSQQNTQRDAIRNMYNTYKIGTGGQFNLQFNNVNTPYCNALARGDYSVCNKKSKDKGPGGYDTGLYAYVRDSLKNQKLHFNFIGK